METKSEALVYKADVETERGNFGEFEKIDDPMLGEYVEEHDAMLARTELGSGNNGIVYKMSDSLGGPQNQYCAKALWQTVEANIRGDRKDLLPDFAKDLRKVQDYFERVKSKKREFVAQGRELPEQLSPTEEAKYTNRAGAYLNAAGSDVDVPMVHTIVKVDRKDKKIEDVEYPYAWEEKVHLLILDYIPGVSIEELILRNEDEEIRQNIDFESFESKLEEAVEILHEHGLYHNDISTRNIMISPEGEPVLIDFGGGSQSPKGQPHGEKFDLNKEHLRKTLKWLRRYLENPDDVSEELTDLLDEL
jgi:serine/threonine protein kinase